MKKIPIGFIYPSSIISVPLKNIRYYDLIDRPPDVGDLVYGVVKKVGQHDRIENASGRIHSIQEGTRSIFVFGNRYAPDYYEGVVPSEFKQNVDMLARSAVVGIMRYKNDHVHDPTAVKILGYVMDKNKKIINSTNYSLVKDTEEITRPRPKLVLVVGSSMNSGKSKSASACCYSLSKMGHAVGASKITGTASLKDILSMEDYGSKEINDFSYFGYPSTYLLPRVDLLDIFKKVDNYYASKQYNFWVVEIADGILQRETSMLLKSKTVKKRIHRLIFASQDALGAIGGTRILKEKFDLVPNAISGICSSSPLALREMEEYNDIPVFNNLKPDLKQMSEILL